MNSLLSSMQFYEATCFTPGNSPILAHSVRQLAAMMLQKTRVDELAAAETLGDAVPETDTRLAQSPAQINFLALEQSRKVDEPDVQILNQTTELLHLLDGLLEQARGLLPAILLLHRLIAIHPRAALQRHPPGEALPLGIHAFVVRLPGDRLANRRFHAGQEFFGLL